MGDEPQADDVVESGGPRFLPPGLTGWRPSRGAEVLAGAALIVGLAVGYAVGDQHARGSTALPKPTETASPSASQSLSQSVPIVPVPAATFSFANSPPLAQETGACSVQKGRELQLGVQVTNQSAVPLTLQTVRAVLPMGGLKQVAQRWAPCGALPDQFIQSDDILTPGASTWLTVTFLVKLRCPTPFPVQFTVGYLAQGHPGTASLPGFPDLGQVPYTGCPANTAST